MGTKFVHQGRDPRMGLDCGGLVVCTAVAAGCEMQDEQAYSRQPWSRRLKRHCQEVMDEVPFEELRAGSVVLLWVMRQRIQQHLGIFTGEGTIVHSWQDIGKVCESTWQGFWEDRFDSAYDLRWPH